MVDAVRVLFVNSGMLGQRTFAAFVEKAFLGEQDEIEAAQVVVADDLSLPERLLRRALCMRLWRDGMAGIRNLDRFRLRAELNVGLVARARMARLERAGPGFDVLHFHRQGTAYASLGRMRRTPSIVSIDCTQVCAMQGATTAAETRSYRGNVRRDGEVFRRARLIVSTSRWAAESVREMYPACETPIDVMPNPVLMDGFEPGWAEERYARARADAAYRPRVLFMGGDFARKGGPDVIAAWRAAGLADRARLDLVTHLPVEDADASAGIHVHTGVRAHSPAWRALWRDADLFVLPTRNEAFGMVFQEAAAAGLPAVGTRLNAIPEIVLDGETGVLLPPGDGGALGGALQALVDSPELRRAMGSRARARIERVADPVRYRDRLAAAIHRLAGRTAMERTSAARRP